MDQRRRAQFFGNVEIVAGNGPLAVVYPLTGVVQHILDMLLCSLGKLLHKGNAVLKADLCFVPFAAAPARLIVQGDDPKLHSKAIDMLAGLFPFHKIVAGAGGKAGLIGQLAGAVENPGFVFPVNAGGAGLALLGIVQPLFFVGSGVLFRPRAKCRNRIHENTSLSVFVTGFRYNHDRTKRKEKQ